MYFLSVILFCGLIVGAIYASGATITYFLNIASFLMVAGISFSLLLGSYTPKEMARYFSVAFTGEERTDNELKKAYNFFEAIQQYMLLSGFIGTMIGAITMLVLLEDTSKVGFGAALALMTLLYGLLIILLIALPFKNGIKKMLTDRE